MDLAFVKGFHFRCQLLALMNYSFVPAIYLLGYAGHISIGYFVMLVQVLAGTFQQVKLLLLLRRWSSHLPHLQTAFDAGSVPACVPRPLALLLLQGGFCEWLCLSFDGLCIGGSWLAWQRSPESTLEDWRSASWPRLPDELGLPMLLTFNLGASLFLQLWEGSGLYDIQCGADNIDGCLSRLGSAPPGSVEAAGERCRLWQEFASRSDVNSLVLLADGLEALGEAEVEWLCSQQEWEVIDAATLAAAKELCGLDLGINRRKILAKLVAGVPSIWLTISLLDIIFEEADTAKRLTFLISICVNMVAMAKVFFLVLARRSRIASLGIAGISAGGAAVFFVLCVARLAGVLACSTHHLDVWDFSCGLWNDTYTMSSSRWANFYETSDARHHRRGHVPIIDT